MFGMGHGGWMLGGSFAMLLWWLVPIALVAFVAIYVLRRGGRSSSPNVAIEILRERNARGEIGEDEIGRRKSDLGD